MNFIQHAIVFVSVWMQSTDCALPGSGSAQYASFKAAAAALPASYPPAKVAAAGAVSYFETLLLPAQRYAVLPFDPTFAHLFQGNSSLPFQLTVAAVLPAFAPSLPLWNNHTEADMNSAAEGFYLSTIAPLTLKCMVFNDCWELGVAAGTSDFTAAVFLKYSIGSLVDVVLPLDTANTLLAAVLGSRYTIIPEQIIRLSTSTLKQVHQTIGAAPHGLITALLAADYVVQAPSAHAASAVSI